MTDKNLTIFENFKIRRLYDEEEEGSEAVTNCHQLKMMAKVAGIKGGRIAKKARLELEAKTGRKVVTPGNYLPPKNGEK